MNEFAFASIKTIKEALDSGKISAKELLGYYLTRFKKYDSTIGSAIELFDEEAILQASPLKGPLAGIPGIVKDNICQKGQITSCASKILQNYRAPYSATVIERLDKAGALRVGRANCDEFAMGSSTETSAYQMTYNPWDHGRVAGGSSGGSIAAVAAGFVPWSLGSETGGSVRQPSTLCGTVGLKPTYGLLSRYGLVAYASSLDQIGICTRYVYDNALVMSAMVGRDPNDATSLEPSDKNYMAKLTGKLKDGFTLGVIENALDREGFDPEVSQALEDAIKQFEKLGAKIKRIQLPIMEHADAVYFMVSRAEAASNLARFDGVRYGFRAQGSHLLSEMYTRTRTEGFGEEVKARILVGMYVLSAGHANEYYESAKKVQAHMRDAFCAASKEVDLFFAPVSPIPAFKIGQFKDNSLALDLMDYFTALINLTGTPGLAVPCGFTKAGLPIGFQLLGPDFSEGELFQAAYAYEQSTEWHTKHPDLP
jgi:aspartyl-tRNA(Asn)/glutamyl-tRNA(Gln) amidotransferase subunit A